MKRTWDQVKQLTEENIHELDDKLKAALESEESQAKELDMATQESSQPDQNQNIGFSIDHGAPITVTDVEGQLQHAIPTPEVTGDGIDSSAKTMDVAELESWISGAKARLAKFNTIETDAQFDAFSDFLEVC